MKLFNKYNRVNIAATIVIFLIGSVGFYFVLQYFLTRDLDRTLRSEKQEIGAYVNDHGVLPVIENSKDQWINVAPAAGPAQKDIFRSATRYNSQEQEAEPVRQLVFNINAGGKSWQITVNKSATETEDLLQLIIGLTVALIALLLLCNYVINRTLIRRLWQPFYRTIDSIRSYHPTDQLDLPGEPIDEIQLLNQSLNAMADQISQDYQTLRTFTENASHEMQTPLSVIRSQVESMMQDAEADREKMRRLLAIEDASLRLSKLHQSLLLLTKLKNRQFITEEQTDLAAVIRKKVEECGELFDSREIRVGFEGGPSPASLHPHLADILIGNLVGNALRYTPRGGSVDILTSEEKISVCNTAINGALDSRRIFQRFYKADAGSDGTGLGLAIVDEICSISGCRIVYRHQDGQHQFIVYLNRGA